jgi:peptidoglycan/LPS O-acetylase OafA/YrhL
MMRFFAAFGVLLSHTMGFTIPPGAPVWSVPLTAGVHVFFVISGFIMVWMTANQFGDAAAARKFLLRRIIRIVPPYWFFTFIVIAAVAAQGGQIRNTTASWDLIATSLLFIPWPRSDGMLIPIMAQGWTLNFEMFFYLVFGLSMLSRRGLWALSGTFVLLAVIHPLLPQRWFIADYLSNPIILEFLGGVAIGRLYLRGFRLARWQAASIIAASVAAYVFIPNDTTLNAFLRLNVAASAIAAAVILLPQPGRLGPLHKVLQAGGDASYALYLSHTLVVGAIFLAAAKAGVWLPWLVSAVAVIAAILFSLVFHRTVEAPVTALLGRRLHARVSGGGASVAP